MSPFARKELTRLEVMQQWKQREEPDAGNQHPVVETAMPREKFIEVLQTKVCIIVG
jgi:hypothetical protein